MEITPARPSSSEGGARWELAVRTLAAIPGNRETSAPASLSRDALIAARRLVEELDPDACLELGSGQSTVEIARAHPRRFVSLDHSRRYLDATRQQLEASGLEHRVELREAPIRWCRRGDFAGRSYDPAAIDGVFEVVLIDGPPARSVGRLMTLPVVWPHLAVGGVALLDDAKRRRLEARCLSAWEAGFGRAVRIARFDQFAKGLALIQKLEDTPVGTARAGWLASALEAAWTLQWRLRHRRPH